MDSENQHLADKERVQASSPRVIIACRVMKPELELLADSTQDLHIYYLEQSLHRTPQLLPDLLQEKVDQAAGFASQIVLGYGLCANGVVGVKAPDQGLIVPRVHDCISLLLGSAQTYLQLAQKMPGTYYLTPGWVAEEDDPLGFMEDYVERVGRETAEWAVHEELKNYTHIALIDTQAGDMAPLRERAKENAKFLDKEYREISGSPSYLSRLLHGPYDKKDFIFVPAGQSVRQKWFFSS